MATAPPPAPGLPSAPAEEISYAAKEVKKFENLRRQDPRSREYLDPLFEQIAVATVRNSLYNSVPSLEVADKVLTDKVALLRERREQLLLQLQILVDSGQKPGGDVEKPKE